MDANNISSGTLAVAQGGTGITSFGAGVATFLGTPDSANLRSAITDETGSGSLVFSTSPTLTGTVTAGTNTPVTISDDGVVTVNNTTASSSTTTGALIVTGGVGVSGTVSADSFNGDISGTISGTASKVTVTNTNTSDVLTVVFADGNRLRDDPGTFTYQASSGTLSATNFVGTNLKLTNTNTITLTAASQSGDATLSIPDLGGTDGNIVVDNLSQTFSDVITYSSTPIFNSNISVKNGASAAAVEIYEASGNGTHKVSLTSPASLTSDATVTLPNATGTLALTSELHSAVTLATVANNYLSLVGQEITAGTVPVLLGGTGATGAAGARSNLNVDVAGTDNSTPVTLASVTSNYLSLSDQEITAGTVPVLLGGTGATGAAGARSNLNVDVAGTDNSTPVTLASVTSNYLSLSDQEITAGTVPVLLGGTGATGAAGARSNLNVDVAGTDNSTPVTLASVTSNYLSLSDQEITAGTVPVSLGGTGLTTVAKGSILVANTANTLSALDGGGVSNRFLYYDSTSDEISWTDQSNTRSNLGLGTTNSPTFTGLTIGDGSNPGTITSNSSQDLVLNTNSGTNSGTITITDGVDGNITLAPNGDGDVELAADTVTVGDAASAATISSNGAASLTVTTGGASDLVLNTNGGTSSGTITITDGTNSNITLAPNGTGAVVLDADTVTVDGSIIKKTTVTTVNTAGNETYSAAQLLGGLILRDPAGTSRNDTTPTAAGIVAAIPNASVGSSFEFTIRNTADNNETITLVAGSKVTLSPTSIEIQRYYSETFLVVCTNVTSTNEEVTIYSLHNSLY